MTERLPLSADDARALLSEHVEGSLDPQTRDEVDAWLARDASLADERAALAATMRLLRTLEPPEPPADMVARVRRQLVAERRGELAVDAGDGPQGGLSASTSQGQRVPLRGRWGAPGLLLGLAAVAGAAVLVIVDDRAGPAADARPGAAVETASAGPAGDGPVEVATLEVAALPRDVVADVAARVGMTPVGGDSYEGSGRAAARFRVQLEEAAALRKVELSGLQPDVERARVRVRVRYRP